MFQFIYFNNSFFFFDSFFETLEGIGSKMLLVQAMSTAFQVSINLLVLSVVRLSSYNISSQKIFTDLQTIDHIHGHWTNDTVINASSLK